MPDINIKVKNKVASGDQGQFVVCGNSDYTIKFDFDSEWDSYNAKTARFIWAEGFEDVNFNGTQCTMPVIANTNKVVIGVYAGEQLHTTTPAVIMAKKSILDGNIPEGGTIITKGAKGDKGDKGDPGDNNVFYGTCSTEAATAAKVVTVDSTFTLQNGVMISIRFINDCYKPTVGNVTLNINGTGAHTVVRNPLNSAIVKIPSGSTAVFVYSNTNWIQLGVYQANGSQFGYVRLFDDIDKNYDAAYGYAATPKAVKLANDNANTRYIKPTSGIPSSDLSTAVQSSLSNADSAAQDVEDIEEKIPAQATSENKLADKAFVNSSIATNTAYFRGTYNSVAELEAYSGEKTNNDYAFVIATDTAGNTVYNRYKWNGAAWVFEYALNNSSFTAEQWAAISSAITAAKVQSYDSHLANTNNPHGVTPQQIGAISNPSGGSDGDVLKKTENGVEWGTGGGGFKYAVLTIATTDWSNKVCTKNVTGLKVDSDLSQYVTISPKPTSRYAWVESVILATCSTAGVLTLTAETVPTINLEIVVNIFDGGTAVDS